jgi:hypothetical protein
MELDVTKSLVVAIALLFSQCWPAAAADQNCMASYYRTKPPACIDGVLSQLDQSSSKSGANTVIGFVTQIFSTSPEEKQRVLREASSRYVRSIDLAALYSAGLRDEARKFADENQLAAQLQKFEAFPPLAAVKTTSSPGENDQLIGAYMASGDTALIGRILAGFADADDATVSDGLRMGLMKGKFGPNLTAEGRDNVMAPAACAKYQCKTDPAKFFRVLTLASAYWALQSLSPGDDGIKKTFSGFFASDPRLKTLLAAEQAALGNYVAAITMDAVFKPDPNDRDKTSEAMNEAASAYENFEPAGKVFDHIEAYIKSGKKSK